MVVVRRATRRAQFSDEAALSATSPEGPSKLQHLVAATQSLFLEPGIEADHFLAARLCGPDGPHVALNNDNDLVFVAGQRLPVALAGGLAVMLGKTVGGPCRAAVLAADGGDGDYALAQDAARARLKLRQLDVDEADAAKTDAVARLVRACACTKTDGDGGGLIMASFHVDLIADLHSFDVLRSWFIGSQGAQ
jgi:hypothetical protein